jgi:predicted secreted protein
MTLQKLALTLLFCAGLVSVGVMLAIEELQLKVGDSKEIKLRDQSASTGYQWFIKELNNSDFAIKLSRRRTQQAAGGSRLRMGVPSDLIFTIQAVSVGKATLTLVRKQAWESEVAEEHEYQITVSARRKF